MRDAEGVPDDNVGVVDAGVAVGCDPGWETYGGNVRVSFEGLFVEDAGEGRAMDLPCEGLPEFCGTCLPAGYFSSSAYLVTCKACLANPARSQTRLPSFGIKPGISLDTNL